MKQTSKQTTHNKKPNKQDKGLKVTLSRIRLLVVYLPYFVFVNIKKKAWVIKGYNSFSYLAKTKWFFFSILSPNYIHRCLMTTVLTSGVVKFKWIFFYAYVLKFFCYKIINFLFKKNVFYAKCLIPALN